MQTIDLAATATPKARSKGRKRTSSCAFCGDHFLYELKDAHQCPGKVAAYAVRVCANAECKRGGGGTRARFLPKAFTARYCCVTCREEAQEAGRRASDARRGRPVHPPEPEPASAKRAAEMAPIHKRLAKAARKAAAYVPLMGEELYSATMRLMREEA